MGYADIPTEVKAGRNQIVMEVDREELSQVIGVLQAVLKSLAGPNMLSEQGLPIMPPTQSANGWLPESSPRGQSEQSLFASPLPQARAVSSSLFSAPFPVSSELSSSAYSTSSAVHPPGVNVSSPAIAALQHRLGRDGGTELGLSASAEWEGSSGAINVPRPSLTPPGYPALARPGETRQGKPVSPIAPPQSLAGFTSPFPQLETSLQSRPPATSPVFKSAGGQAQQQFRLELGTPPGIPQSLRIQAGPGLPSASPKTKAAGLQVSNGDAPATASSLGKAPGPGQSHVFPGPQGPMEEQQHGAGQARGFAGPQAVVRPGRPGPVQSPGTLSPSWTPDGDRGLGRAEHVRKTHVPEAPVPNQIGSLPGKMEKMTIGQRGGSHVLSPSPMNVSDGAFGPRGPIGQHPRMQGSHAQMSRAGVGMAENPRMFPEVEPKFSKGGLVRVPIEASLWRGRWTTAAAEHNRDSVTALNYSLAFGGLSERDSHTGWLISSSKNLLNLWECVAQKKPGESPLQLSHSQATEFILESMDIDPVSNVLISIGANPREPGFCIPVHSLRGESFFSYSGMIRVPENPGISALRKQGTCPAYLQAVSLSSAGGPLRTSVAAGVGVDVLVYDLAAVTTSALPSAPPPPPKAYWRAHDAPISAMHRSAFTCALLTGAADGSIRLWDMKAKPTVPARQCMQQKQITGLSVLDEVTLSSCGADGAVHLWDLRQASTAFLSINPDGKAVVNMGATSSGESIALTTRKGLYCWELSEVPGASSLLSPFTPLPPAGPCTDLKWNGGSKSEVYASSVDGTISVFVKA